MINISIIVPIYNVEKYLDKCLKSLTNQKIDYKYEIILINDGSTDKSEKIIKKYIQNYENIIYIKKKNGGLSDARNEGLKIARGEYIGFVDSDDYISKYMYSNLLKRASEDNSDIVICGISRVDEKEKEIRSYIPKEISFFEILNNAYAWNKIYKKILFENIEYPVGKHYEDIFTTPKLYLKAKKISFVEEKLYYYLEREGAITKIKDNKKILDIIDAYINLKEYLLENDLYKNNIKEEYSKSLLIMKNNFILRTISSYSIKFFNENQKNIIKKFEELGIWKKQDYIKLFFSKYIPKNYIKRLLKGEK